MISFEAVSTEAQAEQLRVLRNQCREQMTGDTSEIAPDQQRQFLRAQVLSGRVRAWLLRVDGVPAAYAILAPGERGELWMSCGAGEAHRGKGLGSLTVRLVTAMGAHLSPGRPVRLKVWGDNEPARRAYLRAGYHIEGTRQKDGRTIHVMASR